MIKRIYKALDEWEHKVDLRNPYTCAMEEIVLADFAELFKDTYEIIKTIKNEYMHKNILPDSFTQFEYLRLLTTLSKYMTYDIVEDESDDRKFSATCIIAQKLVEYATWGLMDNKEESQGIFSFCRDDYPYYGDIPKEPGNTYYKYDVYRADFTEVLELAAQL